MAQFMSEITPESLNFIINHVFLPPQLPQTADDTSGEGRAALLKFLHHTAVRYTRNFASNTLAASRWPAVVKMLLQFEHTNSRSADGFADAVSGMADGHVIGVHIAAQNAGLVLTRTGDSVLFTSFEASPTSEAVTSTVGKLLISYPGPAIAVPWSTVQEPKFLASLAELVEKLTRNVLSAAAGKGVKAGETLVEERESAHPRFVTELLTGILRAVGKEVEVDRFMKRVADEVLWDNTKVPWRRSPLWLVVRVALRMVLGQEAYKHFMIFFMARVLHAATVDMCEGDRLFVMNTKLARRVSKLRDDMPAFVLDEARVVGDRAHARIEEGWQKAQRMARRVRWDPTGLQFGLDAVITMVNSRKYVMGLRSIQCVKPEREGFVPKEAARIDTAGTTMPDLTEPGERTDIVLADFERWVMNNLDRWMAGSSSNACVQLGARMEDYMAAAKQIYQGNPLRNSIMILTTMELWAALDKLAVSQCPLMAEYSPEFNESFLSALLLPQAQQRARLARLESYIKTRRLSALVTSESIFSEEINGTTFSVRYFGNSDSLQRLEQKILEDAAVARHSKSIELKEKTKEYDALQARIQKLSCDYFFHRMEGWSAHDRKCVKCALTKKADRMRIEIHEWPLPEHALTRAAVVFELQCPAPFAIWRETTFRILTDICSPVHTPQNERVPRRSVEAYSGLKLYFDRSLLARPSKLAFTSDSKSFYDSHYQEARLPTTFESICFMNPLKFALFDTSPTTRIWTSTRLPQIDIRHLCTFRIPDGPYKPLQYAIRGTSHSANQVLSRQYECPPELQLHEYIAFGLLRSGRRLQWMNMLRELRSRTLTFGAEAVSMLFMQAAWQVGPTGEDEERENHVEPGDAEFGTQMMMELDAMLKGVESNWQEVVAAQTMIVLAGQILAGTRTPRVREAAVGFLRKARRVALAWARELSRKLPECGPEEVREFQGRVVEMAVTCRMTFDVEECHLEDVLCTEEDVAVLVECATIIQHNVPAVSNKLQSRVRALLDNDRRMSYAVEGHLRDLVTGRDCGIDLKPVWSAYEQGEGWTAEYGVNERWVYTYTRASEGHENQKVHYNLISGELLVEALPWGRMPVEYSNHPTYRELFEEKVYDVVTSGMGLIFQTKDPIDGHRVSFARHEEELIIRAECEADGSVHQLIPRSKLSGDFPANILADHVFWLRLPSVAEAARGIDKTDGHIDLRDVGTPWTPKPDWFISRSYHPSQTYLRVGPSCLSLDVRSATTTMITDVLAPLEFAKFIDIRFRTNNSFLTVNLPRMNLDFQIDNYRQLECKQFPGMTVYHDQSIGTFIGLENLLVVRQGLNRSVIVPQGSVSFRRHDSHTKVEIQTIDKLKVKYHIYTANSILGTLVGNGSLTSHLYKIYLHAVTSHCHPDPLTRRTGTEEALVGLRAAATRSFQTVAADGFDAELFGLIAALTPERVYYPVHLQRMQQVKWRLGLSPIAQHDEFCRGVKEVTAYAGLLDIFEDVKGSIVWRTSGHEVLAKRAALRNAVFRTEEFGGSIMDKSEDRVYEGGDMGSGSSREARVCYVARLVKAWKGRLHVDSGILGMLESLGDICGPLPEDMGQLEIGYDELWLDPKMGELWIPLYNDLRKCTHDTDLPKLMFLLSTIAYSGTINLQLVQTLLAFATEYDFFEINPPNYPSFNLQHGYEPNIETISTTIQSFVIAYGESGESELEARVTETEQETNERRLEAFKENQQEQENDMLIELISNWPCTEPEIDDEDEYPLFEVPEILQALQPWFDSWNRNVEFRNHIAEVQAVLDRINTHQKPSLQLYRFQPCEYSQSVLRNTIRFSDLLTRPAPVLPPLPRVLKGNPAPGGHGTAAETNDDSLETLLRDFRGPSPKTFRKKYMDGLEKSVVAFQDEIAPNHTIQIPGLLEKLRALEAESKRYMSDAFNVISARLGPLRLKGSFMSFNAGLWPRISPLLLLQQLASNADIQLSPEWKTALVTYGTAITMVQRLQRLFRFAPKSLDHALNSDFLKELENIGHSNWSPSEHPDWLLIEIENNFLIRPVQADIARSMIAPPGNQNSIMQLCMGEGKTSVIVPIVAASLADRTTLVRVVVLKPLSGQMFQTLVQKLGGLVNRRIFFMPFSRGIAMGKQEIAVVKRLYADCMENRGILLVQPEHILSFKLLGLEWLYNSQHKQQQKSDGVINNAKSDGEVARLLIATQRWLEERSRDILDESDEILNVRHELIYTIGNPAPIENHPDRWVVIQEIFDLIHDHLKTVPVNPQDFELETHKQEMRFGSIRILNLEAGKKLLHVITARIINGQLLTISFRHFPPETLNLVFQFIVDAAMTSQQAAPLLRYFSRNNTPTGILFLLRGLIGYNILLFTLKEKRWKVDYGLDLKRSSLAVPYRAKDSPAGKAEFSHPDVAITLTCLSYYYGGLNEDQLETCFRNLYKSDNPTLQYERWIKGVGSSKLYPKRLSGINLEDKKQWKEIIYPSFNYNKAVIDSYLSVVVFPKEAKEFPHKLSTSGWDVAASKVHPTTGFSGTNDNRYLLPLSMTQLDTQAQLNTNARVLSYLLQKENNYMPIAGFNNQRLGVNQLLDLLARHKSQIKVLLDVGAQVLELKNHEVAKSWLDRVPDYTANAVVYFDEKDELTVRTRDGNTEPLRESAFAEGLDNCLVYLDELHTRGTDLKLLGRSRAAVTLGPNLTKDRLVQACMRMRKLGNGHSVLFCGPPEIHRKILEIARNDERETIEVRDVLFWCMEETCNNARKLYPIWAKQGLGYEKHLKAWTDIGGGKRFPSDLLEKESKTLIEHYGFDRSKDETIDSYRKPDATDHERTILDTCKGLGVKTFRGARMLEEQERELAHEVECERVNQRPPRVAAVKHHLSEEVKEFIATGTLPQINHRQNNRIVPAFGILATTSQRDNWEQTEFSGGLRATSDFCEVVERGTLKDEKTDAFLRPVHWIVSSTVNRNTLVVMTSFEVNKLLPKIRKSSHVILHMYSPQVTLSTPSYELLDFCPIPCLPLPWQPNTSLIDQLNLFAGQLYFPNYEAYQRVCGFLGLYLDDTSSEKRVVIRSDGFVDPWDRKSLGMKYESPFKQSPVAVLRGLIGLRRKGQSYITTHMGHVLHGRLLMEEDFEANGVEE